MRNAISGEDSKDGFVSGCVYGKPEGFADFSFSTAIGVGHAIMSDDGSVA